MRALRAAVASAGTRYVAPGGGGNCSSPAAACGSVAQAYRAAAPGDAIEVGPARTADSPSRSSPAAAARPSTSIRPPAHRSRSAGLNVAGSYATVRGIRTGDVDIDAGATVVQEVTVVGGQGNRLFLNNARNVTILGGSYGAVDERAPVQIGSSPSSQNITFDGVDFHDAIATDPNAHLECVWAGDVQGFTVRNSLFRNCAYFGLFITHLLRHRAARRADREQRVRAHLPGERPEGPYAMMVADWLSKMENFTFRNNTFETEVALLPTVANNVRMVGQHRHRVHLPRRRPGTPHNVWTSSQCGSTDRKAAGAMSQFVDRANHNGA